MISLEYQAINCVLDAIEDLDDMIPLLEHQDKINQTIVSHSVSALKQIFTKYKHELDYGIYN